MDLLGNPGSQDDIGTFRFRAISSGDPFSNHGVFFVILKRYDVFDSECVRTGHFMIAIPRICFWRLVQRIRCAFSVSFCKPVNFMKYLHSVLPENDQMARGIKTDQDFSELGFIIVFRHVKTELRVRVHEKVSRLVSNLNACSFAPEHLPDFRSAQFRS
jgi:hypothetical protein